MVLVASFAISVFAVALKIIVAEPPFSGLYVADSIPVALASAAKLNFDARAVPEAFAQWHRQLQFFGYS